MKLNELYPSNYLKAEDFDEGQLMIVTIDRVEIETLGKKQEEKPVLYFQEQVKPIVMNKTNASIIGNLYGQETDNWTGKRIVLFTMEVDSFGDVVRAIRVKTTAPRTGVAPVKQVAEPEPKDLFPEPAIAPLKTLGLPPSPLAGNGGKRKINFGKSTQFPALVKWAIAQGFYAVGDTSAVHRIQNILLGEGIELFEDVDIETYKTIITAHYAKQAQEEGAP